MKVIATPSQFREQGRDGYPRARNPYVRSQDTCAWSNWIEGWLQAKYAAAWNARVDTSVQSGHHLSPENKG
jgi:hypothetical protein